MSASPAAINTISALVAIFLFLPTIAHGQPATGPAASCANRFPYEPKQFLEKLLTVAEEADPYSIPAKFQLIFGMKFSAADVKDAQSFSYETTACEWYTHVQIGTSSNLSLARGVRVFLSLGEFHIPLRFGNAHHDECLSITVASNSVTAAGWKGGSIELPAVVWLYRKGHTALEIRAVGSGAPDGGPCVTEMVVAYH